MPPSPDNPIEAEMRRFKDFIADLRLRYPNITVYCWDEEEEPAVEVSLEGKQELVHELTGGPILELINARDEILGYILQNHSLKLPLVDSQYKIAFYEDKVPPAHGAEGDTKIYGFHAMDPEMLIRFSSPT